MATSLSDILQSDIESELAANEDYAALSAAQKLQLSNTAIQSINNMSVAAAEAEYVIDNLASGIPLVIGPGYISEIRLAVDSVAGTTITFDTPFPTSIISTGDYVVQAIGFKDSSWGAEEGEKVDITIVPTASDVSLYPAVDNTNIFCIVIPVL